MSSLAVDIGAESGRVVAGTLSDGRLSIDEVCRFPNTPIRVEGSLRWDIQTLINHVRNGIDSYGLADSVGVDTWGVDYVLLNAGHNLVEQPFHYRDSRTAGVMERLASSALYQETGIQFLPFNTIFQLAATPATTFAQAKHFLTIPDYILHQLSLERRIVCEYTNATTTQLLNAKTGDWSSSLLELVGAPRELFPTIVQPGSSLGKTWNSRSELIAPACHDTGSAVVAIPSTSADVAWISSGTWSILGVEQPTPLISDESYRLNYTNEGGVCGTVRLCKNVMGLWILQECRRGWGDVSYGLLHEEASFARSIGSTFDPDDARFLAPSNDASTMEERILGCLAEQSLRGPSTRGEMVRLILESLAAKYAVNIEKLESLIGRRLTAIHIFGGGSQNALLNQLTANACGRPVIAGPVEATAIGNLLMQMISLGEISSLVEAREIVRNSFECRVFEPA
jgi:rhamnulokinase